jgi:uncharacterized protein YhjY with autotransporter beta-barrel domain
MFKSLALLASIGSVLVCTQTLAYDYGEHAMGTLDGLVQNYPGRYRDTAHYDGAANWVQSRIGDGYSFSQQHFSWHNAIDWSADLSTQALFLHSDLPHNASAYNVVAHAPGTSGQNVLVGAHFDTYFGRPTLQGFDDNASGTSVMTEIARNLSGLALENGLTFVAFGAEEEGLVGSTDYMRKVFFGENPPLLAMINIDSLITGDKMYAGANGVWFQKQVALRDHVLRIAKEMNIDLISTPSGRGCCSDAVPFEELNIPVLFAGATNWDLGKENGHTQTDHPGISDGVTWHEPEEDNQAFLTSTLGKERIAQRLRDFSRVLTRLVLELTNADLLASTQSGAHLVRSQQDYLQRQQHSLARMLDRRWMTLQGLPRATGSVDVLVGAQAGNTQDAGIGWRRENSISNQNAHIIGDYQWLDGLNVGASLSLDRSSSPLQHGGKAEGETWQAGVFALYQNNGQWLAANMGLGYSLLNARRSLLIQPGNGPVLLSEQFTGTTRAWTHNLRITGGYDFNVGALRTGPFAGVDYNLYRMAAFKEDEKRRTALGYPQQFFDSLQASIGWRVRGDIDLPLGMNLRPYGSLQWVNELSEGRPQTISLTSLGDGRARTARLDPVDTRFTRLQLGGQWSVTPDLSVFAEANQRLGHDEGRQPGYTLGVQWQF